MNGGDEYTFARLTDAATRAARTYRDCFSVFLSPAEAVLAARAAKEAGAGLSLFGGYEDSERVVARFSSGEGDEPWPVVCIAVEWNKKYHELTHRDLLGAIMALGIERETFGDIAAGEGVAYVFALESVAKYIAASLVSAGSAQVSCSILNETPELPGPEGEIFSDTVQSMRLDAVIAAGYRLSRTNARERIIKGLVKLNHLPELRPDAQVRGGDMLSLRGGGRVRVMDNTKITKKGRIHVEFFRYMR